MSTVLLQKEDRGFWKRDNLPSPLSPQEEKKLFQKLEKNPENEEVREEIIERNRRLVRSPGCEDKELVSNLWFRV